jgi:hypothetical protein
MFSSIKYMLDFSAAAEKRKAQLNNEETIDKKIQRCSWNIQLEYFHLIRKLNRVRGGVGYSLHIHDMPEHIKNTSKEIDDLQAIMLKKESCICHNAMEVIQMLHIKIKE